jgi:DNA-directed RNA polymerase subunit M/transcription elongation factor TFIIS
MGKNSDNRRCPKCGGNLYIDKDYHGWYEECLQCAYMKDLEAVYENKKVVEIEGK